MGIDLLHETIVSQKLDISNKFSTGQKNVTNIALMLAVKKIATTSLDIFMIDDSCQSLDELNVASFVEIIKNEFTDTQVILSTHEDTIASYIKYKNDNHQLYEDIRKSRLEEGEPHSVHRL